MPVPAILASILNSIIGEAVNTSLENAVYNQPLQISAAAARVFPDSSKMGELSPIEGYGRVVIDGKNYSTAPGLQIRNQENYIVMPDTVLSSAQVRFLLDDAGEVNRIWLLTRNEIAAP